MDVGCGWVGPPRGELWRAFVNCDSRIAGSAGTLYDGAGPGDQGGVISLEELWRVPELADSLSGISKAPLKQL